MFPSSGSQLSVSVDSPPQMEPPAPPIQDEAPFSPPWSFSDLLLDFNLDISHDLHQPFPGDGNVEVNDGSRWGEIDGTSVKSSGGEVVWTTGGTGEGAKEIGGGGGNTGGEEASGREVEVNIGDDDAVGPSDRVRKRDPRLVCSNFLAGRIPCACPELDKAEEEEKEEPGRKRVRSSGAMMICQVPGCEADIGGLKGYHKRHRVCLTCAAAGDVAIDGNRKRYCQQCGKFHMLSSFDGDKRSCRRKLARHNDRRRRKASESNLSAEREQGDAFADDITWDDEIGKESTSLGSQVAGDPLSESGEGQIPIHCSDPSSQITIQNDSVISLIASDEQIDIDRDDFKHASASPRKNMPAYSSSCPTGRISFKLYDWNPAEFPRRLRHQIFDWLSSMPVELEGYIRPGCTMLTAFISMPNFMWTKLREDPIAHIRCLIASSGNMLCGRDPLIVYLDNMIFHVKRDGTSIKKVNVKKQAPKLLYVHPRSFLSGKPIEFIACGSNMLQPKFRFLVSFGGKYIAYGSCASPLSATNADSPNHQLLKVQIPPTEPDLFGPAFVEVENESGVSNFIPILIGDDETCSEINIMEQKFESALRSEVSKFMCPGSFSDARQTAFSQVILDTSWLLRKSTPEDVSRVLTSSQITRFNYLITFLMENKSTSILKRVLHRVENVMDNSKLYSASEADFSMLRRNMDLARKILYPGVEKGVDSVVGDCVCQHSHIDIVSTSFLTQVIDTRGRVTDKKDDILEWNCEDQSCQIPLMSTDATIDDLKVSAKLSKKLQAPAFRNKYMVRRPLIFTIALAVICFGFCVVTFHPENVDKISTTIRRRLFDNT